MFLDNTFEVLQNTVSQLQHSVFTGICPAVIAAPQLPTALACNGWGQIISSSLPQQDEMGRKKHFGRPGHAQPHISFAGGWAHTMLVPLAWCCVRAGEVAAITGAPQRLGRITRRARAAGGEGSATNSQPDLDEKIFPLSPQL